MLKSNARQAGTTQGRNTIEESQYVSSLGHKNMKNNLEFLIVPQASPLSLTRLIGVTKQIQQKRIRNYFFGAVYSLTASVFAFPEM
jgi:hypothetical protein